MSKHSDNIEGFIPCVCTPAGVERWIWSYWPINNGAQWLFPGPAETMMEQTFSKVPEVFFLQIPEGMRKDLQEAGAKAREETRRRIS